MIENIIDKYLLEAKKDVKKQEWMRKYEMYLSERPDHQPGKVDWDTAEYLYSKGWTPNDAAKNFRNPYKK